MNRSVSSQSVNSIYQYNKGIHGSRGFRSPSGVAISSHRIGNQILLDQIGDDFDIFSSNFEEVFLKNEELIYQSGEKIHYVYFPETAVLSKYQILENGGTTEVAIIGREGIAGLEVISDSDILNYWLRVSVAGRAYRIRAEVFKQEFDENADFRTAVLKYNHSYVEQLSQRVVCNTHHLVEERLCSWLLMMEDRTENGELLITHEQISQLLGVQRPSITRILHSLKETKVLNCGRKKISIRDRSRLLLTACSCYDMTNDMF